MEEARCLRYRANPATRPLESARERLRLRSHPAEATSMSNPFLQLGMLFAAFVLITIVALQGEEVTRSIGLLEPEVDPVLVFMIPQPARLARVRDAIADDRVLWEGAPGFALVSGRIYVHDLRDAGTLIRTGDWVDRPVQIVSLGMDSEGPESFEADAREGGARLSREQRLAKIRQLVNKPSLTRGEQIFVLQAMNDGLEI